MPLFRRSAAGPGRGLSAGALGHPPPHQSLPLRHRHALLQPEYPFRGYDLFYYVYVLFYPAARQDPRFGQAVQALADKTVGGQMVVERVVPKLAKLNFCRKGCPSAPATRRWQEICRNLAT